MQWTVQSIILLKQLMMFCVLNGDAGCQIHESGSVGRLGSAFGAEIDTNLGANPLCSTQQLRKRRNGKPLLVLRRCSIYLCTNCIPHYTLASS